MFKTILKTLALSATALTLLSACGASDSLNAAISAYDANLNAGSKSSGFRNAGSGTEEGDEEYLPAVLPVIRDTIDRDTVVQRIEEQPIRRQLTAEESGPIEPEDRSIAVAEESRIIEEEPIAIAEEASPEESAPYVSIAVHPGTNTYIMDPPFEDDLLVIEPPLVKAARLAEEARIAEELRVAEEARRVRLAEEKRIAEENPPVEIKEQPLSRAEKRRLAILAEKQRIKDELKADPSAFNTTSARVASIRVTGTHEGDDNYDITRSKTQDTFGISRDEGEDPVLTMTVNGVGHKVAPYLRDLGFSGGKVTIYYNENGVGPYFTGSADIKKIIRGTHATIQGDYVGYATDMTDYGVSESVDYTRGFATIGIQTPAPVVDAQTAVATYNGTGSLLADLNSGDYNFWRSLRVSITMNVDFDANTIAGTGTERHSQNKITFNSAPIVGNGFEGTFAMNSHARNNFNLDGNPTGQYGGNFFGANADDLAGVMSFQGASKDLGVDIIGSGGFRADRQ